MFNILISILILYILPIEVLGRPEKSDRAHFASTSSTEDDGQENYKPESIAQAYQEGSTGQTFSVNYTLPWPATESIQPTVTFQGMNVTSVIPIYETCNLPGASTTSYSPSFQTHITTKCSTVLTGYFTRHTVSECDEIVTFSTQYGYSLATTTASASRVSHLHSRSKSLSVTKNNVHNITTYYAAPWQSIAADDPSDIHVTICGLTSNGVLVCTTVTEVWVIHTKYLPVYSTEVISVSTVVSLTGVLALASDIYVTITPGTLILSTQIVSTSLSAKNVTSKSTIGSMSSGAADLSCIIKDSTTTIYITGPAATTTMNLDLVSSLTSIQKLKTRRTTITSTRTITRTTTFTPRRIVFQTT